MIEKVLIKEAWTLWKLPCWISTAVDCAEVMWIFRYTNVYNTYGTVSSQSKPIACGNLNPCEVFSVASSLGLFPKQKHRHFAERRVSRVFVWFCGGSGGLYLFWQDYFTWIWVDLRPILSHEFMGVMECKSLAIIESRLNMIFWSFGIFQTSLRCLK